MATSFGQARSDDANNFTVIHPSPRLCSGCVAIQWPALPQNTSLSDLLFHRTFYALQESADQGCALCRLVWLALVKNCKTTHDITSSLNEGFVELSVHLYPSISFLWSSVVHDNQTVFRGSSSPFEIVDSSETELLVNMKSRQIKAFNGDSKQKELQELIKHQIQPWMDSCGELRANHERCHKRYIASNIPTRLVRVGQTKDRLVKLVETKSCSNTQDFTYLILSYCWGNGNENSKTTERNLEMRLRGFSVWGLSKTIQDAILLTRLMGFQYLWVDALCIIQGPNGDFHSEAPRMGDYYSNSACCISASIAKDSQEGFLTERPLARFPMDDIAIRVANRPTAKPGYTLFEAKNNHPELLLDILTSPVGKRGWCLQETALAKRIMHWTRQGLYLQCQSSLFPEDSKVPCDNRSYVTVFPPQEIMALPDADVLFSHGWYKLISVFSEMELTYETDRLFAIHGLACILIGRLKTEYFNGIFRPSLAQGLLWYHDTGRPEAYERPKHAQLPSWCWASSCPVAYMEIHQTPVYIKDDHPQRPLQFPTHSEALGIVESTDTRLYFRAPILKLVIGGSGSAYIKSDWIGRQECFSFDYVLDANRQVMQSMPRTNYKGEWGQGFDVLWLPVGRSSIIYSHVLGLLVHEVPNEGKGVYCRYGILTYYEQHDSMLDEEHLRDVKEITLI